MAFSPAFTISQSALNPALITATDTSTNPGDAPTITQRRIFFQTSQSTYLVESGVTTQYNVWPLANTIQSFNVLKTDQALAITVQWCDINGGVVDAITQLYCLAEFNKQFFYYLIQQQGLTPGILQDSTYFSALSIYWMNITGAIRAIEIGADIAGSQNCLERATSMKQTQNMTF